MEGEQGRRLVIGVIGGPVDAIKKAVGIRRNVRVQSGSEIDCGVIIRRSTKRKKIKIKVN